MTEKAVMEGIQDTIQSISNFASSDVVINDWTVLDASGQNAPYVIIENSDIWSSMQGTLEEVNRWEIIVNLIYYLADTDWTTGMNGFRDTRQAILDAFNAVGTGRSAGGLEATDIERIRAETPITYMYPDGVDPEFEPDAMPIFAAQSMVFEAMEF
jgi:hypothetical protein